MRGPMTLGLGFYPPFSSPSESEFIGAMRKNRATHVELVPEDMELASRFTGEGFSISFHWPYWWDIWQKGEETTRKWLKSLLSPLEGFGKHEAILVLHAAVAPPGEARSGLFSGSVDFLRLARQVAVETLGSVTICLENLTHGMSKKRIGNTEEELVELRRAIGHDDVKFCLDIGHHIMGLRFREESTIPDEFLDNVSMVHLHGVEGMDRPREKWWDHYPLGPNSIPWEGYLRTLLDRGYEGTTVLEIFRGLDEDPDCRCAQLSGCFDALRQVLNSRA